MHSDEQVLLGGNCYAEIFHLTDVRQIAWNDVFELGHGRGTGKAAVAAGG